MKVTEPATGPDSIRPILVDDVLHHCVLLRSLDTHQVHAHTPADVPSIQPTYLKHEIIKFWNRKVMFFLVKCILNNLKLINLNKCKFLYIIISKWRKNWLLIYVKQRLYCYCCCFAVGNSTLVLLGDSQTYESPSNFCSILIAIDIWATKLKLN